MSALKRVETFLRDPGASVLALVGPSGSGKLYTAERAAQAVGVQACVLDRAQGEINYGRLGATTLAALASSLLSSKSKPTAATTMIHFLALAVIA